MISREQIEHIAKLARMELTEKEKEKFSTELSSILDYIDKLNQVETKAIEPISQITGLENIVREDAPRKEDTRSNIRDKFIKAAPAKKDNYFKVPKILE
ncbi:MAG: asparaginyl/glutamyl-tRNA amidotransferase subunit C [Candidatus Portnoybacteria bacterium RBG_13_40_8]|uniref:Aspartyl/glutamyl-tRNA(Asn/Gln) amidotransferase subunit C n=1 Tax=Candidatus Portnoybacteria bacterium RBG_13_40_8 TaxID=1801990 RepID=A0A1G2F2R2_9BACT|nr:MAG: asparaginyl/glutamyl-tRNA amidotransferase subunit C [Candidatus Portnoybacteria bacterium RBG_13_40_8]OGZ36026.1 MAG: asparaginyl/glutamyl-tRNA amidotransferase subunit C [Candidatus Portnoybacteria bacterium RIFCSPHIGHO2_01_FULL_39_19]